MRSFLLFLLLIAFHLAVLEYLIQHTFFALPLQLLETNIVASTQSLAGIDVFAAGSSLFYPGKRLELVIGPLCTGIREMLLFTIIILPFGLVSLRRKLRSLAVFLPIILLENIARLWMLYPLAGAYGIGTMYVAHDFVWTYGQMAFLLLLVFVWFRLFASPAVAAPVVHQKGRKRKKRKGKDAKLH